MLPPLFLDPRLKRRQEALRRDPSGPAVNGGFHPASACGRRGRAPRTVVTNPIPFGWSEAGETLFFRFKATPASLLEWARSEEVGQRQERHRPWPRYLVVLVPDSTDLFDYAHELEELTFLDLGVGHAGSWANQEAWTNAHWAAAQVPS